MTARPGRSQRGIVDPALRGLQAAVAKRGRLAVAAPRAGHAVPPAAQPQIIQVEAEDVVPLDGVRIPFGQGGVERQQQLALRRVGHRLEQQQPVASRRSAGPTARTRSPGRAASLKRPAGGVRSRCRAGSAAGGRSPGRRRAAARFCSRYWLSRGAGRRPRRSSRPPAEKRRRPAASPRARAGRRRRRRAGSRSRRPGKPGRSPPRRARRRAGTTPSAPPARPPSAATVVRTRPSPSTQTPQSEAMARLAPRRRRYRPQNGLHVRHRHRGDRERDRDEARGCPPFRGAGRPGRRWRICPSQQSDLDRTPIRRATNPNCTCHIRRPLPERQEARDARKDQHPPARLRRARRRRRRCRPSRIRTEET